MKTNFRNLGIALFLSVATIGVNATELKKTIEIEPAMELEEWMTDNTLFEKETVDSGTSTVFDFPISNLNFSIFSKAIIMEIEPAMELEEWMTDNTLFETEIDDSGASTVVEIPISNPDFSIRAEAAIIEIEPAMELESWMTDTAVFEIKKGDECQVK